MLKSILAGSSDFRKHGKFWTDTLTWVEGCTPISPGCKNCWLAGIYSRNLPGLAPGLVERVNSGGACNNFFNGKIICREDRLLLPLRARKPRVYAIWSDLGHEDVPFGFHALAHDVMKRSTQHHFLVITKRPESFLYASGRFDPLPNVTLLVTMEDQERARERAPYAARLALNGWRVGLLCEPLLSPISFRWITGDSLAVGVRSTEHDFLRLMSWVITGGESGHKARPAHPSWVRALRNQVKGGAGIPFMFKQWGEWGPTDAEARSYRNEFLGSFPKDDDGLAGTAFGTPPNRRIWPVKKVGKAKAGRVLDGREWLEVP
jgi:protein gp37